MLYLIERVQSGSSQAGWLVLERAGSPWLKDARKIAALMLDKASDGETIRIRNVSEGFTVSAVRKGERGEPRSLANTRERALELDAALDRRAAANTGW